MEKTRNHKSLAKAPAKARGYKDDAGAAPPPRKQERKPCPRGRAGHGPRSAVPTKRPRDEDDEAEPSSKKPKLSGAREALAHAEEVCGPKRTSLPLGGAPRGLPSRNPSSRPTTTTPPKEKKKRKEKMPATRTPAPPKDYMDWVRKWKRPRTTTTSGDTAVESFKAELAKQYEAQAAAREKENRAAIEALKAEHDAALEAMAKAHEANVRALQEEVDKLADLCQLQQQQAPPPPLPYVAEDNDDGRADAIAALARELLVVRNEAAKTTKAAASAEWELKRQKRKTRRVVSRIRQEYASVSGPCSVRPMDLIENTTTSKGGDVTFTDPNDGRRYTLIPRVPCDHPKRGSHTATWRLWDEETKNQAFNALVQGAIGPHAGGLYVVSGCIKRPERIKFIGGHKVRVPNNDVGGGWPTPLRREELHAFENTSDNVHYFSSCHASSRGVLAYSTGASSSRLSCGKYRPDVAFFLVPAK